MLPPSDRLYEVQEPDARSPYAITASKTPTEVEDYGFDFEAVLWDEDLVSCAWEVLQGSVVVVDQAVVDTAAVATISGGVRGEIAVVACTANGGSGRVLLALLTLYLS